VRPLLALLAALPLAACTLGFGDDTGCGLTPQPDRLVNPATLTCEFHAPTDPCVSDPSSLSWGACDSTCRALGEPGCLAAPACRGAYDHDCFFGIGACSRPTAFLGCYPTDVNADNVTGCPGLDAWSCSRHELCVATYRTAATCFDGVDQDGDGVADDPDECALAYVRCVAEPTPTGRR
jgi:hypothetical protein